MSTPVISIITPFYNACSFIGATIESVLNQTFTDFEFLLLDDGSPDNSVSIVQGYKDERIHLIQSDHNFIKTSNKGLRLARGKYIARLDADDIMLSSRLQEQYDFMEQHPDIDACGCWLQTFGDQHRRVECLTSHEDIVDFMITANPMAHSALILRNATLKKYNLCYNENYIFSEDFKLCLDIAAVGRLANIPKVLLHYRTSEEQASNKHRKVQQIAADRVRREAIEAFLNRLPESSVSDSIKQTHEQLKNLTNQSVLSFNEYCRTMYEIARGVRKMSMNM